MNIKMVGADKDGVVIEFLKLDVHGSGIINMQISLNKRDVVTLHNFFHVAEVQYWK